MVGIIDILSGMEKTDTCIEVKGEVLYGHGIAELSTNSEGFEHLVTLITFSLRVEVIG